MGVPKTEDQKEAVVNFDDGLPTRLPRVAILTNIIPPFQKQLFAALQPHCQQLRILISTEMEPNRRWVPDWEGLDVQVQKTVTFTRRLRHPHGSDESSFIHLPIDTPLALARFNADVVISLEMGFRTALAAVYRTFRRQSKLLVWARIAESTEVGRGRLRSTLRKLLRRRIDGFIVNGESGARYLRSLGVEDGKIFKAPYSTDVVRFSRALPVREAQAARRLLYVGQFVERKGLLQFITVLADWAVSHPATQVRLALAGEGPLEERLRKAPKSTNLQIEFLGFVSYNELASVYQAAGVLVFPTLADEWGTVVNEAMAAGLPVLGSLGGQAVEELVQDGRNGWVFHPHRVDEMYNSIDRCMQTPLAELERMRESAKAAALRLAPHLMADRIVQAVAACMK